LAIGTCLRAPDPVGIARAMRSSARRGLVVEPLAVLPPLSQVATDRGCAWPLAPISGKGRVHLIYMCTAIGCVTCAIQMQRPFRGRMHQKSFLRSIPTNPIRTSRQCRARLNWHSNAVPAPAFRDYASCGITRPLHTPANRTRSRDSQRRSHASAEPTPSCHETRDPPTTISKKQKNPFRLRDLERASLRHRSTRNSS